MENESKTQPEKNVITDLVDFIYLINHRLVVFLTAACRLPTMVIVMFFLWTTLVLLQLVMILRFILSETLPYDIRWLCVALYIAQAFFNDQPHNLYIEWLNDSMKMS